MKRRQFVKRTTLVSFAALIGTDIVFGKNMVDGYQPLALQEPDPFKLFGLDADMVVFK